MWLYRESGLMSEKIKYFKSNFKNVLVINNDDLRHNKKETLKQIFGFANLESTEYNFKLAVKANQSGKPKSRLVSKIFIQPNTFTLLIRKIVPNKMGKTIRNWINRNNKGDKITIDERLKTELSNDFRSEISELNDLINSKTKI